MKKLPYILLKTALVVCFILGSNIKSFCADETFIYTIDFFTDNQQARVHIKAADGFINSNNYSTASALPHFFENRLWLPLFMIFNYLAFKSLLIFQY
jgi:hypothetical protein